MKTTTFVAPAKRVFGLAIAVTALFSFMVPSAGHAAAGGIPAEPDHNPVYSAIVVLGDSLSDTGRTSAVLTGLGFAFPPPFYAPGRVSNGPIWIEYFAPMMRRPYEPLDNFSWAGATTGNENVLAPFLPGMLDELTELIALPGPLDPKALYVVFGGSNNFLSILRGGDPLSIIPAGVSNLLTIVGTLRAAGAKNIVVIDLPDIGRTPRAIAGGPASVANATGLSIWFNSLLHAGLNVLQIPVVRVSAFDLINNMVAHPKKYGFTNVVSEGIADLANADTHLFWDDVHPSTRAHRHVAVEVFHALAAAGKLGQQKN
jgi:phospholipase/lecithinase/hemolysin